MGILWVGKGLDSQAIITLPRTCFMKTPLQMQTVADSPSLWELGQIFHEMAGLAISKRFVISSRNS